MYRGRHIIGTNSGPGAQCLDNADILGATATEQTKRGNTDIAANEHATGHTARKVESRYPRAMVVIKLYNEYLQASSPDRRTEYDCTCYTACY